MSASVSPSLTREELRIIVLVAAVQFINVLDFMMVMPLGPDFSRALGIPTSSLGIIGGSYTAAAFISGIAGAFFLDRFDRKTALAVSMLGLVGGTLLGGFAFDEPSLVAARIVAGIFGGPATSVSLSIVADVVPPMRRGRAMGIVMMAFSIASVFGVPAGLWLAELGGWQMPFFAVSGLGVVVTGAALSMLPSLRGHIAAAVGHPKTTFSTLFARPLVVTSYVMSFTALMGIFMLVPNISAYVQHNLGFPRHSLGTLYMAGGFVSLVAMRFIGVLVDRFGSFAIGACGTALFVCVTWIGFVHVVPGLPIIVVFSLFMLSGAFRNVPAQTITSKVPEPHERAQFMSVQSAVQHLASAAGAFLSSKLLIDTPETHALVGIENLAYFAMVSAVVSLCLMWLVETGVRKKLAAPLAA